MNPAILALIQYRLERAEEALEDAKLLAANNRGNSCINRLYYACFYSVSALLLTQEIQAKTHAGIRNLFHQHFVKTAIVPHELGDIYTALFQQRNETDYEDLADTPVEDIPALVGKTTRFIKAIELIIQQMQSDQSA